MVLSMNIVMKLKTELLHLDTLVSRVCTLQIRIFLHRLPFCRHRLVVCYIGLTIFPLLSST